MINVIFENGAKSGSYGSKTKSQISSDQDFGWRDFRTDSGLDSWWCISGYLVDRVSFGGRDHFDKSYTETFNDNFNLPHNPSVLRVIYVGY